jgi:hypothetical protein
MLHKRGTEHGQNQTGNGIKARAAPSPVPALVRLIQRIWWLYPEHNYKLMLEIKRCCA